MILKETFVAVLKLVIWTGKDVRDISL